MTHIEGVSDRNAEENTGPKVDEIVRQRNFKIGSFIICTHPGRRSMSGACSTHPNSVKN
jgi:hypothetical protein